MYTCLPPSLLLLHEVCKIYRSYSLLLRRFANCASFLFRLFTLGLALAFALLAFELFALELLLARSPLLLALFLRLALSGAGSGAPDPGAAVAVCILVLLMSPQVRGACANTHKHTCRCKTKRTCQMVVATSAKPGVFANILLQCCTKYETMTENQSSAKQ